MPSYARGQWTKTRIEMELPIIVHHPVQPAGRGMEWTPVKLWLNANAKPHNISGAYGQPYRVIRFANLETAQTFIRLFGGEIALSGQGDR